MHVHMYKALFFIVCQALPFKVHKQPPAFPGCDIVANSCLLSMAARAQALSVLSIDIRQLICIAALTPGRQMEFSLRDNIGSHFAFEGFLTEAGFRKKVLLSGEILPL